MFPSHDQDAITFTTDLPYDTYYVFIDNGSASAGTALATARIAAKNTGSVVLSFQSAIAINLGIMVI